MSSLKPTLIVMSLMFIALSSVISPENASSIETTSVSSGIILSRKLQSNDAYIHGLKYANGYLWATTRTSPAKVFRINPDTFFYDRLTLPSGMNNGEDIIYAGQYIWVILRTNPAQLVKIDPTTLTLIDSPFILSNSEYTLIDGGSLAYNGGDNLWIGGADRKIARFNITNDTFQIFDYPDAISNSQFHALAIGAGYLWGTATRYGPSDYSTVVRVNLSSPDEYNILDLDQPVSDDIIFMDGNLYVAGEQTPTRLYKITSENSVETTVDLASNLSYGISKDPLEQNIFVTATGSPGSILRYDSDLNYLNTYSLPDSFNDANEIVFDESYDGSGSNEDTMFVTSWGSPAGIVAVDLTNPPSQFQARAFNIDDAAGIFINGVMVIGTIYSVYPDSGLPTISQYFKPDEENYVSFAAWDGPCCNSRFGFEFLRNQQSIFSVPATSVASSTGISYSHVLRLDVNEEIDTTYTPPLPSENPDGIWELVIRANGGSAFALVNNLPVIGSTYNTEQTIEITSNLGLFDNKIHFNAWDNGTGTFDFSYIVRHDGNNVWEYSRQIAGGTQGRAHHIQLVINQAGELYPRIELPADYPSRTSSQNAAFNQHFRNRVTSIFDHNTPTYSPFNYVTQSYVGTEIDDPPPNYDCAGLPIIGCYDNHDGYDIDDLCGVGFNCDDPSAIFPIADGEILAAETGWTGNTLGCQITIDHGSGWTSKYSHLYGMDDPNSLENETSQCQGILRASGQISRYDKIGIIGCTGNCEGSHLHLTVFHDGNLVDPSGWSETVGGLDPWTTVSHPLWVHDLNIDQQAPLGQATDLALTATDSLNISIPANYYSEPLTFSLSNIPVNGTQSNGMAPQGSSISLLAVNSQGGLVYQLTHPVTILAEFDSEILSGIFSNTLSFYRWDEELTSWVIVPTTINSNIATGQTNRLGYFALMATTRKEIFLPIIMNLD
jgi:hypothetical protein